MTAPATTTGTIKVVNVRWQIPDAIYIGRYNESWNLQRSPLANPYKIPKSPTTDQLDEILNKYRRWLRIQIDDQAEAYHELIRLKNLVMAGSDIKLACWCAPGICHGNVVKAAIEWMIKENR